MSLCIHSYHNLTFLYFREFLQSIIKYWIGSNVRKYKIEFYVFIKDQHIQKKLEVHAFLETRRNGICVNATSEDLFNDIGTKDLGLRVVSTYYKKSLVPEQYEQKLFLDFLYSNIDYFLDNSVTKSVQLFLSQVFLYAHNDLKKGSQNFNTYSMFISKLYIFCCNILKSELFEVGVQILQILLDIAKGESKYIFI